MTMVSTKVKLTPAQRQAVRDDTRRNPKTSPYPEVRKRVFAAFKEYAEADSKGKWKIADEAAYLRHTCDWNKEEVNNLFLEANEKAFGVIREKMSKEQYKKYRSESVLVYNITTLVFHLDAKAYDEARKSGKPFYVVYQDIFQKKKVVARVEKKADLEVERDKLKADIKRAELEEEVKHGVFDAKERLDRLNEVHPPSNKKLSIADAREKLDDFEKEHPRDKKGINSNIIPMKKEESKSWTAPEVKGGHDIDKQWAKDGREIFKDDPTIFGKFVISLVDAHLLSEDWRVLASKLIADMQKKG